MSVIFRIIPRNFHDEATLTTELTAASGFEIGNTQNCVRGSVWRSTGPDDQSIFGTFADGLARTISSVSFFRHLCSGGNVRTQLYSDSAWTTQVYDSSALPVNCFTITDGIDWGINPYGTGATDPFITRRPYRLWLPPTSCLSYKITFSDNVSTYGSEFWQVSRFQIGNYWQPLRPPTFGAPLGRADNSDKNRSIGGSLFSNVGESWKTMSMDFIRIRESERSAWLDIMEYCGTGRDIVISLFSENGTRIEADYFINCKLVSLDAINRPVRVLTKKLQIEET